MPETLSRSQLIDLVQRIIDVKGTEEEIASWVELVNSIVPHPDILELIYYDDQELTAEQIVDKALQYKPRVIPLPGK